MQSGARVPGHGRANAAAVGARAVALSRSCATLSGVAPSAVVFAAGAVVYAALMGPLGLTFDATPLVVGSIALAAATVGRAPRLTATALTLIGWGAAVLLTRHGPLPDEREAAAFLVGGGLGLVASRVVARVLPKVEVGDGSSVLVVGGTAFFIAFDADWLYDWPAWTAALVAWAAWEAVHRRATPRRSPPGTADPRP